MKEFRIGGGEKILSIIKSFSPIEKVVFAVFVLVALFSSLNIIVKVKRNFTTIVPSQGGSFTEGIVGLPRTINPVLAFTDADRDMSTLVYSGLMKYENGEIVPDIAESYTVSDDGLTYSFILKDNVRFHDGKEMTTEDIEFTIQKIQDSTIKSPKRADWANITIEKESEKEIHFILKQPYSPFLANTTVGILPKHIWKDVEPEQFIFNQNNTDPVGSGPYKINKIKKNSDGVPQYYSLKSFSDFYDGRAYISEINVYFFPDERTAVDAYKSGIIESIGGISPSAISEIASSTSSVVLKTSLPRIFGLFINQNNSIVLSDKAVRQALNLYLDKEKVVEDVLYGYAQPIDSPIPLGTISTPSENTDLEADRQKAKAILAEDGWTINSEGVYEKKSQVLEFTITTSDVKDLKQTAEILKSQWEELGARVVVKVFEYGDLSQNVIKTRKYDALLFGEFVGKDLDLYAFWHSSQRNSPGLNIAMYVNSQTDSLLEKIRTERREDISDKDYKNLEDNIKEEVPAIFIYSPEYIYIVPEKIRGVDFQSITNSSDRWHGISKWFIKTDYIWKIFDKN